MLGLCSRFTNCREEAEDVLMEGFMTVFTTLPTFRKACSLETWIHRIMVNTAIDHYRKNRKDRMTDSMDDEGLTELTMPAEDIATKMDAGKIMELIRQMPEDYRVIFGLHAIEGLALKEIAGELGRKEATVRVYFMRARQWLQERITKMERNI